MYLFVFGGGMNIIMKIIMNINMSTITNIITDPMSGGGSANNISVEFDQHQNHWRNQLSPAWMLCVYLSVFGGGMNIMKIIIITIMNIIMNIMNIIMNKIMNIMIIIMSTITNIITCVDAACIFVFGGGRVAEK